MLMKCFSSIGVAYRLGKVLLWRCSMSTHSTSSTGASVRESTSNTPADGQVDHVSVVNSDGSRGDAYGRPSDRSETVERATERANDQSSKK